MRFLFISTSEALPWGGSEVLWVKVATELLNSGHHVAYSYQYFTEESDHMKALRDAGAEGYYREDPADGAIVKRLRRKLRRKKLSAAYPAFTTPHWLLSLVMEEKPDLVILNACDAYMIWPLVEPFRALKTQGVPYTIMCHLEDESYMFNRQKRDALTDLYSGAVEVSFGAPFGAELVSRQLGVRLPGVEIFDNPRNCSGHVQPWPHVCDDQIDEARRFACVGRLDITAKGQDVILASFASPVWRDRNWQLTFYGKGWEEDYLKKLAAMYGITDRVKFAGYQAGIDQVWSQEEVCLQPSPKEGTPMTVVEAMSAGRPCIVSDIGRMPDLIEEGKTGWVCSRGAASFSAALERAWDQRGEWQSMGKRANEKISKEWDFNHPVVMAERYVQTASSKTT